MHLVYLSRYKNREVVKVLEEMLALARAGELSGLAYVIKTAPAEHSAGAAGDYRRHPEQALSATFALERHLAEWRPIRR